MADNLSYYGIRAHSTKNGGPIPTAVPLTIASGYQGAVNGGQNVGIRAGDPLRRVNTGTYALSAGYEAAENAAEVIGYIVTGIDQYYDGTTIIKGGSSIPYNTVYGSVYERESRVLGIPVDNMYFEIDCDDAVTATTYAAYRALIGEACDHTFSLTASYASARLDISTHGVGGGQWKIVDVVRGPHNRYFDGNYVKLIVECNEPQTALI